MKVLNRIKGKNRRVTLFVADICALLAGTIAAAFFLSPMAQLPWPVVFQCWGIQSVLLVLTMMLLQTNARVWRYAGPQDLLRLIASYFLSCVAMLLGRLLLPLHFPRQLVVTASLFAALGSCCLRILYQLLFRRLPHSSQPQGSDLHPLAILGAGAAGVELMRELQRNTGSLYTVWGFFDDNPDKVGLSISGVPVKGTIDSFPEIIKRSPVHDVVLAIPSLNVERRREIVQMGRELQCRMKILPNLALTMHDVDNPLTRSIRDVKIEDLLGRSTIVLNDNTLAGFLRGKTVLVTGGGGSIGSELCRQIAGAGPRQLIIFDMNENSSYLLQNEIRQRINRSLEVLVEIGSMTDQTRVRELFFRHRPQLVFHAAAHKHVPLMEHCPSEAVANNILGTSHVMTSAELAGVEKFIFISTDKAVNPTSVMGATKRYCEEMLRSFSSRPQSRTCFVSVRFGNVLGSSGSVIPLFREQIAAGGPVTVTDRRITRYFMTIEEAVGLVLRAGAMASASETYILDMGQPMKIVELAENLIRLSGLEPYQDIPIVEIGLRPGEKLYEELLVNDELHSATRETRIFVEKNSSAIAWDDVQAQLRQFKAAVAMADDEASRSLLRSFVPTYGPKASTAPPAPALGGKSLLSTDCLVPSHP